MSGKAAASGVKEEARTAARKGRIEIRAERCKSCSLCASVCPDEAISISKSFNRKGYHPAEFRADRCRACGLCYVMCPEPGCITVYKE